MSSFIPARNDMTHQYQIFQTEVNSTSVTYGEKKQSTGVTLAIQPPFIKKYPRCEGLKTQSVSFKDSRTSPTLSSHTNTHSHRAVHTSRLTKAPAPFSYIHPCLCHSSTSSPSYHSPRHETAQLQFRTVFLFFSDFFCFLPIPCFSIACQNVKSLQSLLTLIITILKRALRSAGFNHSAVVARTHAYKNIYSLEPFHFLFFHDIKSHLMDFIPISF